MGTDCRCPGEASQYGALDARRKAERPTGLTMKVVDGMPRI